MASSMGLDREACGVVRRWFNWCTSPSQHVTRVTDHACLQVLVLPASLYCQVKPVDNASNRGCSFQLNVILPQPEAFMIVFMQGDGFTNTVHSVCSPRALSLQ